MTALVTCGHTRAGLAAVRSLGRADLAVAVGAPVRPALAMWSRFATSTLLLPDASTSARLFADTVAEQAAGRGCVAVMPATDAALWALSRWREALPPSSQRILPPHEAVVRALDRAALHDLAQTLGISCLETVRVPAGGKVEPALRKASRMGLPALVRPLIPWVEREDGTRRVARTYPLAKLAELRRLLYERDELVEGGCLIESRPRGETLGYGTICVDGEPVVEVFQRRRRERRALSGVSTLAETTPVDHELRRVGRRLLGAMKWQGPAMLEFLRTKKDGVLRLVTVVGRLWGSVHLAINAGIDVPLIAYRMAEGQAPLSGDIAQSGVRFRWLMGDIQQALTRAAGFFDPVEGGFPLARRARALGELLDPRLLRHTHSDVFDVEDPMPFVYELQHVAKLKSS